MRRKKLHFAREKGNSPFLSPISPQRPALRVYGLICVRVCAIRRVKWKAFSQRKEGRVGHSYRLIVTQARSIHEFPPYLERNPRWFSMQKTRGGLCSIDFEGPWVARKEEPGVSIAIAPLHQPFDARAFNHSTIQLMRTMAVTINFPQNDIIITIIWYTRVEVAGHSIPIGERWRGSVRNNGLNSSHDCALYMIEWRKLIKNALNIICSLHMVHVRSIRWKLFLEDL